MSGFASYARQTRARNAGAMGNTSMGDRRPPSTRGQYHQKMIDADDAAKIARAWAADQVDLEPTAWPSGTYGDFGPPEN